MRAVIIVVFSFLFFINYANADTFITPGIGSDKSAVNNVDIGNGDDVGVYFESGRSYCCDFTTASGNIIDEISSTLTNGSSSTLGVSTDRSSTTPIVGIDAVHKRHCYISQDTILHLFEFTTVTPNTGSTIPLNVNCVETTLYGGYNTNANPFNFLEIINTTNRTISGKVYAVNYDGTVVIDNQAFSLDAGLRFDIDLHTPAGANKYGSLKVTHDGPLGALQAGVSQYTSSLEQRAHVPLRVREQLN